jgi:hypothetical protein
MPAKNEPPEQCPECGCKETKFMRQWLWVGRPKGANKCENIPRRVRYYKCPQCDHVTTTDEVPGNMIHFIPRSFGEEVLSLRGYDLDSSYEYQTKERRKQYCRKYRRKKKEQANANN